MEQFELFVDPEEALQDTSLWTPREIWVRLNQRYLELLSEDRRLERKNPKAVNTDNFCEYICAFSNTVDGGVLVFGVEDKGEITGIQFDESQIVKLESVHRTKCPLAKPEFRKVPVTVGGRQTICLAVYVPYIGVLVETSKGEAWTRHGDQKHKMSLEECFDYKSTRAEPPFELRMIEGLRFPEGFDPEIIQDFCDRFREAEMRIDWTNEEVLIDRHLLRKGSSQIHPTYALVLLAGKDPSLHIPGSRLRIQRFQGNEEGEGLTYQPQKDVVVEGNVVRILARALEIIPAVLHDVTWLNDDAKFVTTPEYPALAWQEAVVNALGKV